MKILPEQFMHRGEQFVQLCRSDKSAIYKRNESIEVIRIGHQIEKTRIIDGIPITFPERETYPTSEDWGTRGWTYPIARMDLAELKFQEIETPARKRNR